MNTMDVAFCGELLTRAGAQLLEIYKREERSVQLDDSFRRFEEANGMVASTIREALLERFPHTRWSDSEFKLQNQNQAEFAGEYWFCDPIDGAFHFLQGIPLWAISLVLVRDGQPVFSMVYEPIQNELFHACAGEGAFLNGTRIQVARKEKLAEAIVTTSPPSVPAKDPETTARTLQGIAQVMPNAFAMRILGSVSLQLAYVACGRLDGYWEFGLDMYDWLAASLLVREAGGLVTDSQGDAFTWGTSGIIAGNSMLHEELKRTLSVSAQV